MSEEIEPPVENIPVKKGGVIASLASIAKGVEGLKRAAERLSRWLKGILMFSFVIFGADRGFNHQHLWTLLWKPTTENSAKIVQDSVAHVAGGGRFRAHIDSGFADLGSKLDSQNKEIRKVEKSIDLLASHTGNKERIRRELNGNGSLFGYQK